MTLRQLDPGTYTVVITHPTNPPLNVGWCFVQSTGQAVSIEHYALQQNYTPPTAPQSLKLHPVPPAQQYASLTDFFDAMRAMEPPGAPFQYIESVCNTHQSLP